MITRNQTKIKTVLTFTLVALAILAASANADLVAYWPLNDGPSGSPVTGADDLIDAGLTFTDATVEGSGGTWFDDPARGIVFSTGEDDRLVGGTQGIDLNKGFTWSLWVNVASSNKTDTGADVIIGSRNGVWNKLQPTDLQRWADIGGYDVADDTWHHMALVGTTEPRVILYIDGSPVGSDTTFWDNLTTVNDKLEFGGSSKYSEDITGLMSDIAIWDEALSEDRIEDLAAGGLVIQPADPNAPDVDAGMDMITVSGMDVVLAPTVINNDTAVPQKSLSHTWTADPDTGVVITEDGVNPDDPATKEATVTITKATANPSTVTLTLKVDLDGTSSSASDTMEIDVYNDACLAAKAVGPVELSPSDFDENCTTDLRDYAILAAKWLVDYALTAPIPKP